MAAHAAPEAAGHACEPTAGGCGDLRAAAALTRRCAVQRPTAIAKLGEWRPYEAAPAESYLLKPPLKFFQLRWAAMKFNPLTWHCSGQAYTIGEALMTFAIIGQMVVTGFWWAIDPDFRVNVSVTGAAATCMTCMRLP